MKKLLKEKDKLERDALIARMMERDKQKLDQKSTNIVENPNTSQALTVQE